MTSAIAITLSKMIGNKVKRRRRMIEQNRQGNMHFMYNRNA
jgi:hypothetical protein